jgi:HSP20 family protein
MSSRLSDLENTFALMDELRRRMDRVWDGYDVSGQGTTSPRSLSGAVFPRINVYDDGASLVLKADIPGLSEKDVQVTLNNGCLSISGERRVAPPEGYSTHRQERSHMKFARSVQLPCEISPDQTTAAMKNGVLTITLAKAAEAQPRQITVRTQ